MRMSPLLLVALALAFSGALSAGPEAEFRFEAQKIALSGLSLRDGRALGPISVLPHSRPHPQGQRFFGPSDMGRRPPAQSNKLISKMPILRPQFSTGTHPMIKTPNPAIDYKLIVKEPGIETASSP